MVMYQTELIGINFLTGWMIIRDFLLNCITFACKLEYGGSLLPIFIELFFANRT